VHQVRDKIVKTGNIFKRIIEVFRETMVAVKKKDYYLFYAFVCSLRHPVCNVHVSYCHLWPATLYNIFFQRYLINGTFLEKTFWNIKCVFQIISSNLCEIFLILRRTERYMMKYTMEIE
jgi:hypothetical protein